MNGGCTANPRPSNEVCMSLKTNGHDGNQRRQLCACSCDGVQLCKRGQIEKDMMPPHHTRSRKKSRVNQTIDGTMLSLSHLSSFIFTVVGNFFLFRQICSCQGGIITTDVLTKH